MAQPNAGQPVLENFKVVYHETPEQMAAGLPGLLAAGAAIVGGCCGSTPAHIRRFREILDGRRGMRVKLPLDEAQAEPFLPEKKSDGSGVGINYADALLKPVKLTLEDGRKVAFKRRGLKITLTLGRQDRRGPAAPAAARPGGEGDRARSPAGGGPQRGRRNPLRGRDGLPRSVTPDILLTDGFTKSERSRDAHEDGPASFGGSVIWQKNETSTPLGSTVLKFRCP